MPDLTGERKLLLFSVGPVACCADSLSIHRIIAPPENLVHLPGRTHHPSIFRHESRLVSVVDVRALFGLTSESNKQSSEKLIIAEIEGALYGFWVDAVQTIISEQDGKWRLLPGVVPRTLFDAAFNYREQLVLHIDFQTLIHARAVPWVHRSGLYPMGDAAEESETEKKEPSRPEPNAAENKNLAEEKKPVPTPRSSPPPPSHKSPVAHKTETPRSAPVIKRYSKEVVRKSPVYSPHHGLAVVDKSEKPVTYPPATKAVRSEHPVSTEISKPNEMQMPEYSSEPLQRQSHIGQLAIWLLLLGFSFSMVLYYLWPQAETRPAKKSEQVVKTQNRKMPKFVQVDEPIIEEPLQMVVPDEPVQEVMPVEDSQEPEKNNDELSEERSESSLSEVSKEIDGPHATIEREGNMVTITLIEGELPKEKTAQEESYTKEPVTETQAETQVEAESETIALQEEVQVADPQDQAREPEEDGAIQEMSSSSKESVENVIVLRSPSEDIQASAPVTAREIIHVVVRGDTLWDIARRYIHDPFRYPELARLSNIKNPDLIYPGDRVRILIIRH